MKTKIRSVLLLIVAALAAKAQAQTADELVLRGRQSLAQHHLAAAHADFVAALNQSPQHPTANALVAATTLLTLPQQSAMSNFLNRLKISPSGRDLYDWTAQFTEDADGDVVLPAGLNSREGITLYRTAVMPALKAAQTNLARITDPNFMLSLSAEETASEPVDVDYGDIQVVRALLHAGEFLGYTLESHNFNVGISVLRSLGESDRLTIQRTLATFPDLLKRGSASALAASRVAFTEGVARYLEASEFIRTQRPPDAERLFTLDLDHVADEGRFRTNLALVRESLDTPVPIPDLDNYSVYAGAYFAGAKPLRSLVPKFDDNRYLPKTLPDYTMGGLFVDLPPRDVEEFLRETLGQSFAGIYVGEVHGWNWWDPSGRLALFIRTNNQAVVIGYLNGGNEAGIFFPTFEVDSDGWWDVERADFSHWGDVWDDGFEGGYWSAAGGGQFYGEKQSASGPYEMQMGCYSGQWSVAGSTGKLEGILTTDGEFIYCAFSSTDPIDGGSGQFNGTNFYSQTVEGATVTGSINPLTKKITGRVITDDGTGTFSVNRSRYNAPMLERLPAIVQQPQDLVVTVGGTATFTVKAGGGVPLSYQWYRGDMLLWPANAATLSLENVQLDQDNNQYHVVVSNPDGSVTSQAARLRVWPKVKGTYRAIFYPHVEPPDVSPWSLANSGSLILTLTDKGQATGKLLLQGKTYTSSRLQFDPEGHEDWVVTRELALPPLAISLDLNLSDPTRRVSGEVTDHTSWTSQLEGFRDEPQTNRVGRYTIIFPGADPDNADLPGGDGFATLTVNKLGLVQLVGSLADKTAISIGTGISGNGASALHKPLYTKRGMLFGAARIAVDDSADDVDGWFVWIKGAAVSAADKYYTNGFQAMGDLLGSRYVKPASGETILAWTNGTWFAEGGNLSQPLQNEVHWANNRLTAAASTNKLTISVVPSSGLFSGSFVHPDMKKSTAFKGAFLQDLGVGRGWFLGTNQSGRMMIEPIVP
jgi:hypothetical protein